MEEIGLSPFCILKAYNKYSEGYFKNYFFYRLRAAYKGASVLGALKLLIQFSPAATEKTRGRGKGVSENSFKRKK